jgi:hypothetical protein
MYVTLSLPMNPLYCISLHNLGLPFWNNPWDKTASPIKSVLEMLESAKSSRDTWRLVVIQSIQSHWSKVRWFLFPCARFDRFLFLFQNKIQTQEWIPFIECRFFFQFCNSNITHANLEPHLLLKLNYYHCIWWQFQLPKRFSWRLYLQQLTPTLNLINTFIGVRV